MPGENHKAYEKTINDEFNVRISVYFKYDLLLLKLIFIKKKKIASEL